MKLQQGNQRPGTAGFTLVEIAIAIAVVSFALVAIIGVLPTGMQVQKENREETIITHDAKMLIEAIRTGSTNLHNLAGNLEWIQFYTNGVGGASSAPFSIRWFPTNSYFGLVPPNGQFAQNDPRYNHSGARDIIGHLSAPSYDNSFWAPAYPMGSLFQTNKFQTKARFLANSGNQLALEADNARQLSFSYLVTSEIYPQRMAGGTPLVRSNNVHELRLTFEWPVYGTDTAANTPRIGKYKRVFRATISGQHLRAPDPDLVTPGNQASNFFFHPLQFGRTQP